MRQKWRLFIFVTLSSFALCSYIPQKDKHYFDYFLHREGAKFFQTKQFNLEKVSAIYGYSDIDRVYVTFSCFRMLGVKEARQLLIEVANEIVDAINHDPFLIEKKMLKGGHFCLKDLHLEIKSENIFCKSCDNGAAILTTSLDDLTITYTTYQSSPYYTYGQKKFSEKYEDAVLLVEKERGSNSSLEIASSLHKKLEAAKQRKAEEKQKEFKVKWPVERYELEYFSVLSSGKIRFEPQATIFDSMNTISPPVALQREEMSVPAEEQIFIVEDLEELFYPYPPIDVEPFTEQAPPVTEEPEKRSKVTFLQKMHGYYTHWRGKLDEAKQNQLARQQQLSEQIVVEKYRSPIVQSEAVAIQQIPAEKKVQEHVRDEVAWQQQHLKEIELDIDTLFPEMG
jgi:hypothetical protein